MLFDITAGRDQYRDIYQVIDDMSVLTASAQLRSGGMNGSATIDELKAFGSDAAWQQKLLDYCFEYCKKVKGDYRKFVSNLENDVFD